jgi:4-aminobutyrate aminotransferase / (S)-3-amino-2-methylpropionate transaminase / 5-aminovalerate transaminase
MGDVHPPMLKVALLEKLVRMSPWPDARAVLASAGSEAVEIALKTALLRTGRPGILAFQGAYHGLTLGALATTERAYFRAPFASRLFGGVTFAPFPDPRQGAREMQHALDAVERALTRGTSGGVEIGAVIVEPVQGRAGVRLPPEGFLVGVTERARAAGAVIIADEVFTGAGRCGGFLASERYGLDPDLVCLGKAVGGGMPLSACIGRADVMDAWPASPGEALHTSTYLGHPLSCAGSLALLDLLETGLVEQANRLGETLLGLLRSALDGVSGVGEVRGAGLLLGIELLEGGDRLKPAPAAAVRVAHDALAEGFIVLPAGEQSHVVELAPPACLTNEQADAALLTLQRVLARVL